MLVSQLDQYNVVTQYGYDAVGRQTLITDTLGRVTLNEYDPVGRLVKATRNLLAGQPQNYQNEFNIVTQYGYDLQGNQAVITDTLGRVTKADYDALNRPFKLTQNYLAGQAQNYQNQYNLVTTTGYDGVGNVVTQTDTLGRLTLTRYDTLNRPVTLTVNYVDGVFNPARPDEDLVTISAYDEVGNVVSTTDPAGRVTRSAYDALNRPTTVTANYLAGQPQNYLNQYNLITTFGYDAVGNRTTSSDTRGRATKTDYDALNRASAVTINYLAGQPQNYQNQYNLISTYGYDALGRQTVVSDTLGRVTNNEYDGVNRLVAQVDPAGQRSSFGYDALGNRLVMTDTLGHATQFAYDTLNRPITTTRPLGQVTVAQYDALGNRVKAIDPLGRATQYAYDTLNRSVTLTDTLGHGTSLAYDALGRLTTQTDPLGHATTFSYDLADRQLTVADALGNTTRTGYDLLGNRVVLTDANGLVTRYGFDTLSRLISVTENYSATGPVNNQTNVTTRYDYDPLGNRTTLTDALNHATTYQYDALNRLTTLSDALNNSTSYAYDPLSRRTTLSDAKGQVTQFAYDILSRLSAITYVTENKTVKFAYDAVGNRTVMTDTAGVTRYSYDDLYRLTQVVDPFTQTVSYAYDLANNRTNLTYPIANRLTTAGGVAFTWDNNGNLLNDGKSTYTYDQANRLTKVVTGTQTYTMTYNGQGDRLTLSVNGTQTKYANDVAGSLTQAILETTGATKNAYLYGKGHIAQQKTNIQDFGLDGLGSVRQLYNSSGLIVSDRQWDPYGNLTITHLLTVA